MDRRRLLKFTSIALAGAAALPPVARAQPRGAAPGHWSVWDSAFAGARFVALSHVLTPDTPVWKGFPPTTRFQQGTGRLDALKLLHLERKILLHGHEPLDADSTPTLVGEDWLMNNGYMQAEGVANLDQVPPTGALIAIGFPRLQGGTGGFASFTAICPSAWTHGVRPGDVAEAPLPYNDKRLVWNEARGVRERTAACDKPKGKQSFN